MPFQCLTTEVDGCVPSWRLGLLFEWSHHTHLLLESSLITREALSAPFSRWGERRSEIVVCKRLEELCTHIEHLTLLTEHRISCTERSHVGATEMLGSRDLG